MLPTVITQGLYLPTAYPLDATRAICELKIPTLTSTLLNLKKTGFNPEWQALPTQNGIGLEFYTYLFFREFPQPVHRLKLNCYEVISLAALLMHDDDCHPLDHLDRRSDCAWRRQLQVGFTEICSVNADSILHKLLEPFAREQETTPFDILSLSPEATLVTPMSADRVFSLTVTGPTDRIRTDADQPHHMHFGILGSADTRLCALLRPLLELTEDPGFGTRPSGSLTRNHLRSSPLLEVLQGHGHFAKDKFDKPIPNQKWHLRSFALHLPSIRAECGKNERRERRAFRQHITQLDSIPEHRGLHLCLAPKDSVPYKLWLAGHYRKLLKLAKANQAKAYAYGATLAEYRESKSAVDINKEAYDRLHSQNLKLFEGHRTNMVNFAKAVRNNPELFAAAVNRARERTARHLAA